MSYKLPFQKYKCGLPANARPCGHGPKSNRCGGTGDRITCESGDSYLEQCKPVRTLYWWRKIAFFALAALTILVLAVVMLMDRSQTMIAPGGLSSAHAQLFAQHALDSSSRCAACHPGTNADGAKLSQSDLCMKCHEKSMPEAVHGNAHDLPLEWLQQSRRRLVQGKETNSNGIHFVSSIASLISRETMKTTECSQCHREHHSNQASLQKITSERCQACHVQSFDSFAADHPPFREYPYTGTKRIAFDHIKHQDTHFAKKSVEFDCRICHVESNQRGAVGSIYRSVAFETACASCHQEPIQSSMHDGLIVFQVPSLDRAQWERVGVSFGPWPIASSQLNDGTIAPWMQVLLSASKKSESLIGQMPSSGKLNDLRFDERSGQEFVTHLTNEVRELLQSLASGGQREFRDRVEQVLRTHQINADDENNNLRRWLDSIAQGIPPDVFRVAYRQWFEDSAKLPTTSAFANPRPKLFLSSQSQSTDDDDLLLPANKKPSTANSIRQPKAQDDDLLGGSGNLLGDVSLVESDSAKGADAKGWKELRSWDQLAYGGWMIDSQRMAIVYVPSGHSDTWLARWLELERSCLNDMAPSVASKDLSTQCKQCHILERPIQPVSKKLDEPWLSRTRSSTERPITKFDHTPHMSIANLRDCKSCHALNKPMNPTMQLEEPSISGNAFLSSAASSNWHHEFLPMQKDRCASCHHQGAAGDSCIQCHNYHVNVVSETPNDLFHPK